MRGDDLKQFPGLIGNYELLSETGVLEYIDSLNKENKDLENLLNDAYEIFKKESVEELVEHVINCFSDKFIPSSLVFILNQGIMFNRIKSFVYKNLKFSESEPAIQSLEPYEGFFREYSGTTSFYIFESLIDSEELLKPFTEFEPEIIVPINGLSGLYGIILFGPKVLGQEYAASEISYIDRLTKFVSIGMQNNIHYEHSVRDPKTGLYNHNFFIRRVEEETARARRSGIAFSVIILDIDNFKRLNDNHGHLAGDEIILKLAELLRNTAREEDILSRFGGEEFTLLLPRTGREAAISAAERIRRAVENIEMPSQGFIHRITVSVGAASFLPDSRETADVLIRRADRALYKSKEDGRNRTSFADNAY